MAWKFSDLFRSDKSRDAPTVAVPYKGFTITPAPMSNGGQWLTAGVIAKAFDNGETREHNFIRAETHGDQSAAEEFSIVKGKKIIDEFGDGLFKK